MNSDSFRETANMFEVRSPLQDSVHGYRFQNLRQFRKYSNTHCVSNKIRSNSSPIYELVLSLYYFCSDFYSTRRFLCIVLAVSINYVVAERLNQLSIWRFNIFELGIWFRTVGIASYSRWKKTFNWKYFTNLSVKRNNIVHMKWIYDITSRLNRTIRNFNVDLRVVLLYSERRLVDRYSRHSSRIQIMTKNKAADAT